MTAPAQRKKWGTDVARPKPFTVFTGKDGRLAVRIGAQRPSFSAIEISLSAGLVIVTSSDAGIRITGEGVVRRHGETIAITP